MWTDGTRHKSFYLEQSLGRPQWQLLWHCHCISEQEQLASGELVTAFCCFSEKNLPCKGRWEGSATMFLLNSGQDFWTATWWSIQPEWELTDCQQVRSKFRPMQCCRTKITLILCASPARGLCFHTGDWERLSTPLDTLKYETATNMHAP